MVKWKILNIIVLFVNEKGGWFIFGVDEDDYFINLFECKEYELFINNMFKDVINFIFCIVMCFLLFEDYFG